MIQEEVLKLLGLEDKGETLNAIQAIRMSRHLCVQGESHDLVVLFSFKVDADELLGVMKSVPVDNPAS